MRECARIYSASLRSRAAQRFFANRGSARRCILLIASSLVIAVFRPCLASHDPLAIDIDHGLSARGRAATTVGSTRCSAPISSAATCGRGSPPATATSLEIATLATLISLVIGLAIGLVAGYAGGWVDNALMRLVDLVLAFPFLLLAILLAALLREHEAGVVERAGRADARHRRLDDDGARDPRQGDDARAQRDGRSPRARSARAGADRRCTTCCRTSPAS